MTSGPGMKADETTVNSPQDPPVNHLSDFQIAVLAWMLRAYRHAEAVNSRPGQPVNRYEIAQLEHWGVHIWKPRPTSRAGSAARSRALRRLEARGLIERRNSIGGDQYSGGVWNKQHRTVELRFTPKGRTLAEQLETPPPPPTSPSH
jgi:hypothetical protein